MRLLIIRHGDPDYSMDSLVTLGFKQAKALEKYLKDSNRQSLCISFRKSFKNSRARIKRKKHESQDIAMAKRI